MDNATLEELRQLEESLWRGETRFDDALMDSVFAPDFFEFGRSGRIYNRDQMLLGASEAQQIDATLPLPDFKARYLSPDVVQVTYTSRVKYGPNIEIGNRSSIWSRADGAWVLRFHQGTPKG